MNFDDYYDEQLFEYLDSKTPEEEDLESDIEENYLLNLSEKG